MFSSKRLVSCVGLVAAVAMAGCGSDKAVGPESVNPVAMSDGLASVSNEFQTNAAFQSLATLSGFFQFSAASAAVRASLPLEAPSRGVGNLATVARSRRDAQRVLASLASLSAPAVLFPSGALGKTYEWDEVNGGYVQGSATGAPANGVRFLLYVTAAGQPVIPLQQLGHVDLTDESTPQAEILGVALKLGSTTVADYTISYEAPTASSAILTASGRLTNPSNTSQFVDFTLEQSITSTTLSTDYHVQGSNGFSIDEDLVFSQTGASLDFSVSDGTNTLQLVGTIAVTQTSATVNLQIKYNGTVVATISGDADSPSITGANGRQLSQAEIQALEEIFNEAGDVFEDLDSVFYAGFLVF